jgi:hypothetical protein
MGTITNKKNLPEQLVRAVEREYTYQPKRYSITSLLDTHRILQLKRRHHEALSQDVSDMIWMIFGSGIHKAIEDAGVEPHQHAEKRLEYQFGDYTLSGIVDFIDEKKGLILDWKTTSIWTFIYKSNDEKWLKQLQLSALLWYKNTGQWIQHGQIGALLKDYKNKPFPEAGYPDSELQIIDYDLGTPDEIERWVVQVFEDIALYEQFEDDALPMCSAADRWNTGDKWAVMEKGKKRAVRVYDNEEDATSHVSQAFSDGLKLEIDFRPGEDKRCKQYCPVKLFCSHGKTL